MTRRMLASGALLLCLATACNVVEDEFTIDPPPKPSEADIDRLRSSPGVKFWVGRSFDGRDLTHAVHRPPRTYLAYGEPYCDASGCSYDLQIDTSAARDIVDPPSCWRSIGRALVLVCGADAPSARVLTGSVIVNIDYGDRPGASGRALAPPDGCRLGVGAPAGAGAVHVPGAGADPGPLREAPRRQAPDAVLEGRAARAQEAAARRMTRVGVRCRTATSRPPRGSMDMHRARSSIALAALASLALAAPAEATHGCRTSTSKGAHILAQTHDAVVFSKDKTHPSLGTQPIRYGCVFSVGTTHRLTPFTDFDNTFANVVLSGRYVAYSWDVEEGASSTINHTIFVHDLKTGELERRIGDVAPGDPQGADSSTPVYAIVLKRNASIAWTASFHRKVGEEPIPGGHRDIIETVFQVSKIEDDLGDSRTMVDEGTDVEPESLALANDHRRIYWSGGGAARSAPLR